VRAEVDALDALANSVMTECPGVLREHAPGSASANENGIETAAELADAIPGAGERVERAADARFYGTVRRLRWSSSRLTEDLHGLARYLAERAAIPPPPLCADLKSWVASGYTETSAAAKQYLRRVQELPPGKPLRQIARLLSEYEDGADKRLARTVFPEAEPRTSSPAEARRVEAEDRVYEALGTTWRP
jgi:hypothetical protein